MISLKGFAGLSEADKKSDAKNEISIPIWFENPGFVISVKPASVRAEGRNPARTSKFVPDWYKTVSEISETNSIHPGHKAVRRLGDPQRDSLLEQNFECGNIWSGREGQK